MGNKSNRGEVMFCYKLILDSNLGNLVLELIGYVIIKNVSGCNLIFGQNSCIVIMTNIVKDIEKLFACSILLSLLRGSAL